MTTSDTPFDRASLPGLLATGRKRYGSFIGRYLHTIQRLDAHTVIKRGLASDIMREAEIQQFIRAHTSVPVARVIDAWRTESSSASAAAHGQSQRACLVMEWVEGEPLESAWPKMSPAQHARTIAELKAHLAELRALPQRVPGWVEPAVVEGTLSSRLIQIGAFPSVGEFHAYLKRYYGPDGHPATSPEDYYDDGVSVVFSHGGLTPRNILLDPSTGSVVGILSWGLAGWWPEYWEYRMATKSDDLDRTWMDIVTQVLPLPLNPANTVNLSTKLDMAMTDSDMVCLPSVVITRPNGKQTRVNFPSNASGRRREFTV